jgi:extracellular solute-binding protein (family 5)
MLHSSRSVPGLAAVLGPALALGWLAGACAAPRTPSPAPSPAAPAAPEISEAALSPDECVFRPPGPAGRDTVRVIAGREFPGRQLYETLVRRDCAGNERPGVAETWSSADGGRNWAFALRPARFWDGTPVTAGLVVSGWTEDSAASVLLKRAGIIFATAGSDGELHLLLAVPHDSVPAALSDPRLAVVRRVPDTAWPVGTGPYRLPESDPAPATLEAVDGGRPVRLLAPPRDLRDAMDASADIVVTDDPATLAYAAQRAGYTALPLPWSRTYAIVLTAAADSATVAAPGFRDALARDAVRVDARAAAGASVPPACSTPPAASASPARTGARIAYPAADATARDLAARLAALGVAGARAILPLDEDALLASLRAGREAAYVVALPRTLALCQDLAVPGGAAVLPLVDTRPHALVRQGAPPMTVDWDGTLRLLPETP